LASFRESEQSAKPAMSTPSCIIPPQLLGEDDFAFIVRNAPLVSIDLIIRDPEHRVLLGRRVNEPAKGHYFVPGGAIRKNETIQVGGMMQGNLQGIFSPYSQFHGFLL
jgi:hypothetical protein